MGLGDDLLLCGHTTAGVSLAMPPLGTTLCSPQSLGWLESWQGGRGSWTMEEASQGLWKEELGGLYPQGAA